MIESSPASRNTLGVGLALNSMWLRTSLVHHIHHYEGVRKQVCSGTSPGPAMFRVFWHGGPRLRNVPTLALHSVFRLLHARMRIHVSKQPSRTGPSGTPLRCASSSGIPSRAAVFAHTRPRGVPGE